jgi:CRP/FNR family transcriptional regulator, cyclic AMP receptor protein
MVEVRSYAQVLMHTVEDVRTYAPGEIVFKEGQMGAEMYIVRTGTVTLSRDGEAFETLFAGSLLGEMALIDPAPRSATATAGPECSLAVIDEATFQQLVQKVPNFALEMLRIVVKRLRTELGR